MMNKRKVLPKLLIFFLLVNILSSMHTPIVATDPTIVLITDASIYADYNFPDLGVYYTPNELTTFHMPFIIEKTGVFKNIDKYDLDGTYVNKNKNFSKRFVSNDFSILAESEGYYVIDFGMTIWADTNEFSCDLIPKIKDVDFPSIYSWYNSTWGKKVYISINPEYINTPLRNFPIMVSLNSTYSNQADDGRSVRFVAIDNVSVMPLEIESWNYGGTSYVWTMLTNINSSTYQSFWLYFNNTAATSIDQVPYGGVWNDNYTCVYHMDQSASDDKIVDSTSNYYNSTSTLYDPSYGQTGKVHYGIYYNDGTNDEAHVLPTVMTNAEYLTGFTMECWAKFNNMTVDKCPLGLNDDVFAWLITMQDGADFKMRFQLQEGDSSNQYADSSTIIDKSFWYYIAGRFSGTTMYLYLNGTYEDWDPVVGLNTDTDDNLVGGYDGGANIYGSDSVVDEVRISNCDRNTSWIRATYNNINESTCNGSFLIWGSITEFEGDVTFTSPYPPHNSVNLVPPVANTNITVTTNEGNTLNLTWQSNYSGTWTSYGTNNTVGNGTYNQSVDEYFTELGTNYFWRVVAWNGTGDTYSSIYKLTTRAAPENPYNVNAWQNVTGSLNITWTKYDSDDYTVIVMNQTDYPDSETDGTVIYNGTLSYYNDTNYNITNYYTLFAYNTTWKIYSSGITLIYGSLTIYAYNENDTTVSFNYDVQIVNSDASEWYFDSNCSNPHVINVGSVPLGDDILVKINASGYAARIYYMDLAANQHYTLYAYLAQNTNLYFLEVLDPFDNPVENVKIEIKRLINDSVGYRNISVIYTGANGKAQCYLVPNVLHFLKLSKENYITKYVQDYYPDPDFYGLYYPETFRMTMEQEEIITYDFIDVCVFNCSWVANNSLRIDFYDKLTNTTDMTVAIYESYNGTLTLMQTFVFGSVYDTTFYNSTVLNASRMHQVRIVSMNHTNLGHITDIIRYALPLHIDSGKSFSMNWFDEQMTAAFGSFSFGYSRMLLLFIPMIMIVIAGGTIGHPGLGVLIAASYGALFSWVVVLDDQTKIVLSVLITLGLLIGAIVILSKKGRGLIK